MQVAAALFSRQLELVSLMIDPSHHAAMTAIVLLGCQAKSWSVVEMGGAAVQALSQVSCVGAMAGFLCIGAVADILCRFCCGYHMYRCCSRYLV